jgi:gliding motility-associated lipoprotein GldD
MGILAMTVLLASCGDDAVPKPRGYLRLDMPDTSYTPWQGECPFSAEVPAYAMMVDKPRSAPTTSDTACWTTMRFGGQQADVFITYRRIAGDLATLIDDAHTFKNKHEAKAARIRTERIMRSADRVFGSYFDVDGDVASPVVFYLTDSTTHFLYASLYFDARPNADSLSPVTERIREDLRHFARTLTWR